PYDAYQNPMPPMQWVHENWKGWGGQKSPQTAMMIDDRQLQKTRALTADMIACIDDAVGDLTAALQDLRLADDPNETNKLWNDPAHVTTRPAFAE
ncbi:MAG: hypothetical protein VYD85_17705, partial [Pseudomonadota bacterium]|nr:hypothetical protein [Pseudomonadota bacterium]